jgi:hypothetical protein
MSRPVEKWVPVDCAGWRRLSCLAAGYDDSLSKASEGGPARRAALDDLGLVDHALGVAVGRGFSSK